MVRTRNQKVKGTLMQQQPKKHLFKLPDGSTLKYAPHWQTGPQSNWFMSHDDHRVWEASRGPKNRQYRVNLWSSQTDLNIVAADIDKLPEGFASFDSLYDYLNAIFPKDHAIVARSASGNVKVFFLIETPAKKGGSK